MYVAYRNLGRCNWISSLRNLKGQALVNTQATVQSQVKGPFSSIPTHRLKISAKTARMGATEGPGDKAIDNGTRGMEDYLRVALLAAKQAGINNKMLALPFHLKDMVIPCGCIIPEVMVSYETNIEAQNSLHRKRDKRCF